MIGSVNPTRVYLDHNATAPVRDVAIDAMVVAARTVGNPSAVHAAGRAAKRLVEDARDQVAGLVGVDADNVVFTASGTEADNMALKGLGRNRVLVSAVEHSAVLTVREDAEIVPVTADGIIDLAALEDMLAADDRPALVAVMLANNETGVIQPVAEAATIAHAHGALIHCDAVQAAGKVAVDFGALGVDSLALSAHKLGGPTGVGALVLAPGLVIEPMVAGGGQEKGRRSGTENIPGIAAFGAAAADALAGLDGYGAVRALRDALEARIKAICPAATVIGADVARLANTSCLTMPGVAAETQVMAFDLAGICVSAGAACSSGKVKGSRVLSAMLGEQDQRAGEAVRVSFGPDNTISDVEAFVEAWTTLYARKGDETQGAKPAA